MNEVDKKLNELLGLGGINPNLPAKIEGPAQEIIVPDSSTPVDPDIAEDYEITRATLKRMMKKGEEALDEAALSAQASQDPKAYGAVASLITAVTSATKEVFEIHKKKNDLTGNPTQRTAINIDKAVFVGNPSELLRKAKEDKKST